MCCVSIIVAIFLDFNIRNWYGEEVVVMYRFFNSIHILLSEDSCLFYGFVESSPVLNFNNDYCLLIKSTIT